MTQSAATKRHTKARKDVLKAVRVEAQKQEYQHRGSGWLALARSILTMGMAKTEAWPDKKSVGKKIVLQYAYDHGLTEKRPHHLLGVRTEKKRKNFLDSWEWKTLRYKVIKEYGRRCMCCGATPDDGTTVIHVDHIKPRHTHPELALVRENLQVLCGNCNMGKGAWDVTDFRNQKRKYK